MWPAAAGWGARLVAHPLLDELVLQMLHAVLLSLENILQLLTLRHRGVRGVSRLARRRWGR